MTTVIFIVSCSEQKQDLNKEKQINKEEVTTIDEVKKDLNKNKKEASKKEKISEKEIKDVKETRKISSNDYEELSQSELWNLYRKNKEKIDILLAEDDYLEAVKRLEKTTKISIALNRKDIAAWHYNNIGYYLIQEFRKRTNYDKKMQKLNNELNKENRQRMKKNIISDFKDNYSLLKKSQTNLNKSLKLDSKLDNKERTKIINNNLEFISFVDSFLSS